MNTVTRKIQRLIKPPEFPVHNGGPSWFSNIEAELELRLPEDYKELIMTYGDGTWQRFWYLLNPFTDNPYLNLITQASREGDSGEEILSAERYLQQNEEDYPHHIWPQQNGIFPWGITDNGGRFFWITTGNPNNWPTVYYPSRDPDFTRYELSTSEILFGALTGSLPVFAEEFGGETLPSEVPLFEQISN